MARNFFISGMPKAGKTTLLRNLINELKSRGLKVGGFISPEEKHHGTRTAFHVCDIETGKSAVLASLKGGGPKVSKYYVNIKSFESIAIPIMKKMGKYDVFIIDEIGRMEMKSRKFVSLLDELFEHQIPVIASIHRDYLDNYSADGEVSVLTETNRTSVLFDLIDKSSSVSPRSKKSKKQKKRFKRQRPRKKKISKIRKNLKNIEKKPKKRQQFKQNKQHHSSSLSKPKKRKGFFSRVRDLLGF